MAFLLLVERDDAFGEQVVNGLPGRLRHVGGEHVIEAAVLADDDDDVLDRRPRPGIAGGRPFPDDTRNRTCANAGASENCPSASSAQPRPPRLQACNKRDLRLSRIVALLCWFD